MLSWCSVLLVLVAGVLLISCTASLQLSDCKKGCKEYLKSYCSSTSASISDKHNTSQECIDDASCPPWFYCNAKTSKCTCGQDHQRTIRCNQELQTSAVLDCHCVNYDKKRNTTVAGACFYSCTQHTKYDNEYDMVYHRLPSNLSELNKFTCEHQSLNRTGPLCGECKPDTYPLVYSYNLSCVHCPDGHKNWWKFLFVAFLPLTVFYFVVLFFKISATSSHLHGYVLFAQCISTKAFVRVAFSTASETQGANAPTKTVIALYGIWSLDFFRTLIPDICLQTSTLQTLSLDYLIAVYPLFLMIISYVLIELHDRNFRLIVFIWKPFRYVLLFFRRNWNSRTSVIDAYATFFLLSIVKFGSTSFDILVPTKLYSLHSNQTNLVLFYDGSIEYFSNQHLPYAILAIFVVTIFILVPFCLFIFYPFRFFQQFLNCFPTKWVNILHTFVDSFLGCYKDGTERGTRDCRYFAGLFVLLRCLLLSMYTGAVGTMYFIGAIIVLLLFSMLLVAIQPFKQNVAYLTKVNVTFIIFLALFYTAIVGMDVSITKDIQLFTISAVAVGVFGSVPLLYIPCAVIHWVFIERKWSKNLISKLKAWRKGYDWKELESDQDFEESLPDRIVNPEQYHEGNLTDFHNINNMPRDDTLENTAY